VVAEFDTEAEGGDQVDDKHGIHLDGVGPEDLVEHPHGAHELEENEEDAGADDHSDAQTAQDLEGKDHSGDTQEGVLG
jgi:hypothetical protein